MKLLEVKNLNKKFDNKKILKDINFSIDKGKIVLQRDLTAEILPSYFR